MIFIEGNNMAKKRNTSKPTYNHLTHWFDELKSPEVTHIVELIDEAKKWIKSAESIPEEKCQQFLANFKLDLIEFYQQSQSEIQHSLYLSLLKESFWAKLSLHKLNGLSYKKILSMTAYIKQVTTLALVKLNV